MTTTWSKEIFAKNLRYYMGKAGKNQKEMSEIVGVSGATFNEWIKAKKYPRIDKIEKLAQYFGILKSDLIEDKSIKEEPVKTAELHFEMIMDEDFVGIFEDFKKLDEKKRKIVKDLVHNLAETEV